MSSITRDHRSKAWNIQFFTGKSAFAGIYQRDDLVTIGDVARDLDLCVVFKRDVHQGDSDGDDDWRPVLLPRTTSSNPTRHIILEKTNATAFPGPNTGVTQYTYLLHSGSRCAGALHSLDSSCYRKLPLPTRRHNARYAAISKPCETSSKLIMAPVRSRKRPSSTSPLASRNPSLAASSSPSQSTDENNEPGEIPLSIVPLPTGQAIMRSFRNTVVGPTASCAISGLGKSWNAVLPGTGLEAAHIVPQVHWSIYQFEDLAGSAEPSADDRSRLEMAWRKTWSSSNGLPMMSQLHKCFEARLVSIQPQTSRIRAWVDYDVLTQHHGHQANLPVGIDPDALQHQYDMCCIENMVATWVPDPDPAPPSPFEQALAQRQVTSGSGAISGQVATDGQDVAPDDRGDAPHDLRPPASNLTTNYTTHPPSPPSSSPGRKWLCGAYLIEDSEEAANYLAHGWILREVTEYEQISDSEEEQRGRPRKRRYRDTLGLDEEEGRGRSRKRRHNAGPSVGAQEGQDGSRKRKRFSTPSLDEQEGTQRLAGVQLSPDSIKGGA